MKGEQDIRRWPGAALGRSGARRRNLRPISSDFSAFPLQPVPSRGKLSQTSPILIFFSQSLEQLIAQVRGGACHRAMALPRPVSATSRGLFKSKLGFGACRAQAKAVGFVGVPKTPQAPAHVCACSLRINVWP